MDFYKLSQLGLKAWWERKHNLTINHIKNNHKNLTKEKTHFIGFIMGDGSITSIKSHLKGRHHDIKFFQMILN